METFFYFELGGHLGWKSGSTDTFWKGAIQESFQQNLVDIGSVVFEKICQNVPKFELCKHNDELFSI
jgi:hypothetical protein